MFHRQFFTFTTKKHFGKPSYIVAAKRTPIGSFMGKLSKFSAVELGAIAIKQAIASINLDAKYIDEVILGNALQASEGQAPARQAALRGGVHKNVPCTTVNKVCSSGMKSVMLGAQSIGLSYNDIVLTGGFESMSNAPFYINQHRSGTNFGDRKLIDSIAYDGLTDAENHIPLGAFAEKTVNQIGLTREAQDDYTILTYSRAAKATRSGKFNEDIIQIQLDQQNSITEDEEINKIRKDKIVGLKPIFTKYGSITAVNSSKISDGACAIILMSEQAVLKHKLIPLGRILGYADAELDPIDFNIAPYYAITKLMQQSDFSLNTIDAVQIHQAYAATVLANLKMLNLSLDKVNIYGGAVALGHPIGMSGARIIQSLLSTLRHKKAKFGIASICNGGGGASSILLENLRF